MLSSCKWKCRQRRFGRLVRHHGNGKLLVRDVGLAKVGSTSTIFPIIHPNRKFSGGPLSLLSLNLDSIGY